MRIAKLTWLKRKRIDAKLASVNTDELPAVLSTYTIRKIEKGEPVSYRSAVLYCRALGLNPEEVILRQKRIPILEPIEENLL